MDNPPLNVGFKICKKHNQPIRYYDQVKNSLCDVCVQEKGQLISVEQIQIQFQEIIINHYKESDLQLQLLQNLKDWILKYQENIIKTLDKSIQQIIDQIKSIQSQQQSMQQFDKIMNPYPSIENLTANLHNNLKTNRFFINQITMKLLLDFKSSIIKIDFLHSLLGQRQQIIKQTQVFKRSQMQEVITNKQRSFQKIEYQLIQSAKCQQQMFDFAFDQFNSTFIAAMNSGYIKIFDFKNGKVGAEKQSLKKHTDNVYCLYCMRDSPNFVSGGCGDSIIIWCFNEISMWKIQQILEGHKYAVSCLIMNSKEDLLISGSYDGKVMFWKKQKKSWILFHSFDTGASVFSLSLSENEDKLITCTNKNQIIVMETSNQIRKLVQKIKVDELEWVKALKQNLQINHIHLITSFRLIMTKEKIFVNIVSLKQLLFFQFYLLQFYI